MRAVAGGPLSTITHPTLPVSAAGAQSSQPAISALPTPRIDSLLATHHRRQQQRELVQALHVDHRLETIERKLATLNTRTAHGKQTVEHRSMKRAAADSELEDDGSGDTEHGSAEQASERKWVHDPSHLAESIKRKQPLSTYMSAQTQTEPSSGTDTTTQASPLLPSYEQLQQQMLQLQAELTSAREERQAEKEAMNIRQRELDDRLKEAQEQLQSQVGMAVERMKERDEHAVEAHKWRDECNSLNTLSQQSQQALEESTRREAEATTEAKRESKLRIEAEKQWEQQLEQLRLQLSHAQTDEARMRSQRDRAEAEERRVQLEKETLDGQVKEQQQREQKLTEDIAALSQQVKQLQSHSSELQQQTRQAKETEAVVTERLARDRLLLEEQRRQLTDKLTESEARLTALSSHYVDKQRDVSDLKELIKLSVRSEREARVEADEAQEEVRRRGQQLVDMQRQWQHERSGWKDESDRLQVQLQAYQTEQQTVAEVRSQLLLVQSELDELRKQTSRSDTLIQCRAHWADAGLTFHSACRLLSLARDRLLEDKRRLEQQLTVEQLSHSQHYTAHTDELQSLRNELLLKAKLYDDHTDSLATTQQQLRAARAQLDKVGEREKDMERQVGYLEEQRRELQRQVEELTEQLGEWREKGKGRNWQRKQLDELHATQQLNTQQLVHNTHTTHAHIPAFRFTTDSAGPALTHCHRLLSPSHCS